MTNSFLIYSVSFVNASGSSNDVNIFLTIQELTIFKYTFLVGINALSYVFTDITFVVTRKFKTLLVVGFMFIIGMHVLAILLNATKLWLKPGMRVPVGILFILFYLGFIGINVYI